MAQSTAGMMEGIDARTQLVGNNRLELLLFRLSGRQRYGINVFKVREVVSCPEMTKFPNAHPSVRGVINMRGNTFMVVDLQHAIGMEPIQNTQGCSIIVTEYNRKMQGFLVPSIEHIVNKNWEEVNPPPKMSGKSHYLTAVTYVDDSIVEILDVEKVLFEITGSWLELESDKEKEKLADSLSERAKHCHVLIADDSSVARNQLKRTLSSMDLVCTVCNDGKEALDKLTEWANNNTEEYRNLALVISDVEMPNMDGYTLTNALRGNPKFDDVKILLHTSLSGTFDSTLLDRVKADGFLSKFDHEELSHIIMEHVEAFAAKLDQRSA